MASVATSPGTRLPADPPEGLRLVFLIGMPRSGTTWVTWLLSHHPEVVTFRHSGLFYCFEHVWKWWTRDIRYTSGRRLAAGDAYATASSADALSPDELTGVLRGLGARVIERLCASSPGARAFVDQTPEHIAQVDFARRVFPEARFLHVVRDPRAVYASIRSAADSWATPGSFPRNPIQIARRWRRLVAGARVLQDGGERCLELSYERLHAAPEAELERLHRWLGLATSPALVRAAIAASDIAKLRESAPAPSGFFRRGSARGWEEELPPSVVRVIEHEAGDEMARWGYERRWPAGRVPLSVRAYDRVAGAVRGRRGRLVRAALGALARVNRTLDLMRQEGDPPSAAPP